MRTRKETIYANSEVAFDNETIMKKVAEIAKEIDATYQHRGIHLLGTEDSYQFVCDLSRSMTTHHSVGFTTLVRNRNVVLVTPRYHPRLYGLCIKILDKQPTTLAVAALLHSDEAALAFKGFRVGNQMFVGYGLGPRPYLTSIYEVVSVTKH